ncbi:MAG: 50S ribosomal protein L22 [Parcubacteria group bacterium GW2011_GWC1_39_29]|uniref:Large ribosomal subunit protein uL22 n=1 Tax=Candidatus Yanofskybacteria bacterium GW2011_GWD1_39_16 TaxID=1619030 RepID=A0A837HP97_9BACT|nr:MAG: 50S ribosomal protein L22 [Candidatus Yanofskybacteria bacterium GW2011_GWD1_39_16]KKR14164.1 MAG: 50S ribosomal protein L22 [Parcubacteria group bacterium GW2011_GWC1_39_29]
MEVKSKTNNLRLAPRKVRAVVNLIRGKGVNEALDQLEFLIRRPSSPVIKLVKSAIANAENNFHLVRENLFIKEIKVDEGVKLKRFMPRGFGRASTIQKKTSHITLVLDERVAGLKRSEVDKQKKDKILKTDKINNEDKKPEIKKEIGQKSVNKGFVKKMFQRKSI